MSSFHQQCIVLNKHTRETANAPYLDAGGPRGVECDGIGSRLLRREVCGRWRRRCPGASFGWETSFFCWPSHTDCSYPAIHAMHSHASFIIHLPFSHLPGVISQDSARMNCVYFAWESQLVCLLKCRLDHAEHPLWARLPKRRHFYTEEATSLFFCLFVNR